MNSWLISNSLLAPSQTNQITIQLPSRSKLHPYKLSKCLMLEQSADYRRVAASTTIQIENGGFSAEPTLVEFRLSLELVRIRRSLCPVNLFAYEWREEPASPGIKSFTLNALSFSLSN